MKQGEPELDNSSQQVLTLLLRSAAPISGRRVASALSIAPTTANKVLHTLRERGLVSGRRSGSAVLWAADEARAEVRALRRKLESATLAIRAQSGVPADSQAWAHSSPRSKAVLKAVVLTALEVEYAAVRTHLTDVALRRTRSGTRYDVGVVRGEHLDWEVHLSEVGMGNSGAAGEVAAAIEAFSPRLILFVGVAGGLKPGDQKHGDVVVASIVYNVHSGKLVPHPDGGSQVLSRPLGVPAHHRLTQLVRAVGRTSWASQQPGSRSGAATNDQPAVHLRAIVAGEVVLADPDSGLRKLIAERFNDAAAIDMESHGVYETANRYDVPVLAVRGLSDLLGDKTPEADREHQPRAVANAAAFAIALLRNAEEVDLPPPSRFAQAEVPLPPGGQPLARDVVSAIPVVEEVFAQLPPTLMPWWRRLHSHHRNANEVVAELAKRSNSPNSWLNRLQHRLPSWLRDDLNGNAWALVARFADAHNSPHATWLYDEAATRAERTGEDSISWVHRLRAALAAARPSPDAETQHDSTDAAGTRPADRALHRLTERSLDHVSPLTAIFRDAIEGNADAVLRSAPPALAALGLPLDLASVYPLAMQAPVGERDERAEAVFAEMAETDPDVVDQLRGDLLVWVAYALLSQREWTAALSVLVEARKHVPAAATPLVLMAKIRLQRAGGPGGLGDAIEVSSELAQAEELALVARDRFRSWNADSSEAVAIAIRARADRDPHGALRLALPAPRGTATDREASNPQVREAGAAAAMLAGDPILTTELATGVSDVVERDLLRSVALAQTPGADDAAEEALRRALSAVPETRPDQLVRALLGLVRLGAPVQPDQPGSLAAELARLRRTDAEAADVVEALAHLRSGHPRQALVITRQYPTSVAAVEIAAEAHVAEGNHAEAVRTLTRAGRARRDESLRLQAMFLATDAGLERDAMDLATQLLASNDPQTRRRALEAQLVLAQRGGLWEETSEIARRLLEDDSLEPSDARREQHIAQYQWALVNAEFNLRRPDRARQALNEPSHLQPRNPSEALLLLTVLRASAAQPEQDDKARYSARLGPADLERALAAASAFPGDEDVLAAAIKIFLISPAAEPLPADLLTRARALQEDFFDRFPDSNQLRRITVGDDLSGLIEHMRATVAPAAEHLVDLARQVWLGIYPQALLADVTGRSYAETLIKRVVGHHVAVAADPVLSEIERTAAHAARETGSVVVDTSTLVLIDHLDNIASRLLAEFSRRLIPANCRDDALEARDGLALRSTGTLGWNPEQQRPQATEVPTQLADSWADAGVRLAKRLSFVETVPGTQQDKRWSWNSTIRLAEREGTALWADDLALRHAARAHGVPAFGTAELVDNLIAEGVISQSVRDQVVESFRSAFVVDLPLNHRLLELAAADDWEPAGYAALLLARPRMWAQISDGLAMFRELTNALPTSKTTPELIAGWAAAAMTGLAWAVPPPTRSRAVAALVAWTALSSEGSRTLPGLLEAAETVLKAAAPDDDPLPHVVSTLAGMLGEIVAPAELGRLFTHLITNLDPDRRTHALHLFLTASR